MKIILATALVAGTLIGLASPASAGLFHHRHHHHHHMRGYRR